MKPSSELPSDHEIRIRLRILVITHLVLCAAPVLQLVSFAFDPFSLTSVTGCFPAGSLMLVGFWAAMTPGIAPSKVAALVAMVFYCAYWTDLPVAVMHAKASGESVWGHLVRSMPGVIAMNIALLAAVIGGFLISRRWIRLVHLQKVGELPPPRGMRYSVGNLLVLMGLTAIAITLIKSARTPLGEAPNVTRLGTAFVVIAAAFFLNTLMAARAALAVARSRWQALAILVVAAGLGLAISLAAGHDHFGPRMILGAVFITVGLTGYVYLSLLVVRSCGYRLVPASSGTARVGGAQ